VRSITHLTTGWLSGSPEQYQNLDQLIEAAELATAREPHVFNVWPPPPPAANSDANAPGRWPLPVAPPAARHSAPVHDEIGQQTWPGASAAAGRPAAKPAQRWPVQPPPPPVTSWPGQPAPGAGIRTAAVVILLMVCLVALLLVLAL
jgi:hypothetical protein